MNRRRSYTNHFLIMALLTAVTIGVVNYLGMEHRARIDLTADKRFTLSEGTKRLFDQLPEAVTVTYYVDEEPPSKRVNLERDVVDKLEELARSSGGKLQYRVDRVTNAERAERRSELEELGVVPTVDLLTSGADEAAEARGVQGFYSSIEVRYGTAEPIIVNEVVNLVDRFDEQREHRVDTLEFDIAYAILRMQHRTERPSLERLLRAQAQPIRVRYMRSRDLPERYVEIANSVHFAAEQIAALAPDRLEYEQIMLDDPWTNVYTDPFGTGHMREVPYFDGTLDQRQTAEGRRVLGTRFYITALFIQVADRDPVVMRDFREYGTPAAARNIIEDALWELTRPRTRLGIVLPPSLPQYAHHEQPGQPPVNFHRPLFNFLQGELDYEVTWVDIKGERRIPRDLAFLLVLDPNLLTEREIYEIDRYLAEGGNVAMMVQGWSSDLDFSAAPMRDTISLTKENMMPHFTEWARHIGLEFGQDLLLRSNSVLTPFVIRNDPRRGQVATPLPTSIKLAPKVESADLNDDSVISRGLVGLPLPLPIELKLDEERTSQLGLESTEIIRLRDDVHRFIPANPRFPEIPIDLDLAIGRFVEQNPNAEPGDSIRAQRLGHQPLIAVHLRGQFPSLWVDEKRNVPGWDGGDPSEQAAPPILASEGSLIVFSCSAMLNTSYFSGYQDRDIRPIVIDKGVALYRNVAESFIYGDDIVGLRARTGTAPRIQGPVSQDLKVFWFLVTVLGVPFALLVLAVARMYIGIRDRAVYEEKLAAGTAGDI